MLKPGDTIMVTVAVDGVKLSSYSLSVPGVAVIPGSDYTGYAYTARLLVPPDSGDLLLVPQGITADNLSLTGPPVKVRIRPTSALTTIAMTPATLALTAIGQNAPLTVTATYADDKKLDVTAASTGTVYQSDNNTVVATSVDGVATATGVGAAVITARNGTQSAQTSVTVSDAASLASPVNVTDDVNMTLGPLTIDTDGYFNQTVTIVNHSGEPLIGPLDLVALDLPASVTLMSSGRTVAMPPPGAQYVLLPLANGLSLPVDGRLDLALSFIADRRRDVHFTPMLYRSAVP